MLEVLKWCSASDLLLQLSQVCHFYSSLSNQPEVWFELLGPDYSSHSDLSPKQQYRFVATQYIPVVSSDSLRKFIVHSQSWQSLPLSSAINVDRSMSSVLTVEGQVFVTGTPSTPDTFQIHPISGLVTILDSLITHRNSMGVIRYQANIYAFAGSSSKQCEVYMAGEALWRPLPPCLSIRSAFTPTQHSGKIYLLGGCGTVRNEYFDTVTEIYHPLPMKLPGEYCTVAICTDIDLYAVQQIGYYCCELEKPVETWELTPFSHSFGTSFWSGSPVLCIKEVYYIYQTAKGRIIALNLKKRTFQEFPAKSSPT